MWSSRGWGRIPSWAALREILWTNLLRRYLARPVPGHSPASPSEADEDLQKARERERERFPGCPVVSWAIFFMIMKASEYYMCLWWLRVIDMCMYIIAVSTVVCTFPLRKVREGILIDVITSCLDLERRTNQKLLEMTPDWPLALHHQTPEELDRMRFESDEGWGRWEEGGRKRGCTTSQIEGEERKREGRWKSKSCGSERKRRTKSKRRGYRKKTIWPERGESWSGKGTKGKGKVMLATYPDSLLKGKHKRSSS